MTTPAPLVRPAAAEDLPALADLAARTFPLACPPDLPGHAVDDFVARHLSEAAFGAHLTGPGERILVVTGTDGDLVGYALLVDGTSMDPDCTHLLSGAYPVGVSKFYLDASRHGSGAAGVLMDAAVDEARERGGDSLWLATNEQNARARAFYARCGFVERGGRTFLVGGLANRDVVYQRML